MRGKIALALLCLVAGRAGAAEPSCPGSVRVVGAKATYRMPLVDGRAVRRDAAVEVELVSSATVAVVVAEFAVFLGASLEAIQNTRAAALPTARPRLLEGGGLAFRAQTSAVIPPGATKAVAIEKAALPLEGDLSSVTAIVLDCRTLQSLGDAEIRVSPSSKDTDVRILFLLGAVVTLALITVVRLR